jgi:uncharacterized protein involved in response to NO
MTQNATRGDARRASPPILQNAFRPFFLAAALLLVLMVPAWALEFLGRPDTELVSLGRLGHIHEMFFGFLSAIVCGFALTAIPNWTGRAPVAGVPLAAIFGLWILGRLHVFWPEVFLLQLIDMAFLVTLAAIATREIVAGSNWRNIPITIILAILALAHIAFHIPEFSQRAPSATLGLATCLIGLIGGRITPSFTRNWLATRGNGLATKIPRPMTRFDTLSMLILVTALLAWVVWPIHLFSGAALLLAAVFHLVRLSRWQGFASLDEPLVWSLHAGYLWLVLALLITGSSILWPTLVPASAGTHALGSGMIATMALAVMTRSSLGHTGRERVAGPATTAIYILVHTGAALRVAAAIMQGDPALLALGAVFWSGAFAMFVLVYAPILWGPRVDGS